MIGTIVFPEQEGIGFHSYYQHYLSAYARTFEELGLPVLRLPFAQRGAATPAELEPLQALAGRGEKVAAVIDLASWGWGMSQAAPELFEEPVYIAWLADHPHFQPTDFIRAVNLQVATQDESHIASLVRLKRPGHIKRAFCLPFAAVDGKLRSEPVLPMEQRPIDVLFVGNYAPEYARPPWLGEPSRAKAELLEAIVRQAEADEATPISEVVAQVFNQANVQPGAGSTLPELLHEFLGKAENHLRVLKRYRYVEKLARKGVPVHVCGRGWDATPIGSRLTLIAHRDYAQVAQLYGQARVALNISNYVAGMNDRPALIMAAGTACVHDESSWMRQAFRPGTDLVFAPWAELDMLPDLVRDLLADGERLAAIGASGRQALFDRHTLQQRATDLLAQISAGRQEANADLARHHLNSALALQNAGRLDDAIAGYRAALALGSEHDADARNNLAVALRSLGRWDEAVRELEQVVQAEPQHGRALSNLALLQLDSGHPVEAEKGFSEVLALDDRDMLARYNRGLARFEQWKLPEAQADFAAVASGAPGMLEARIQHFHLSQQLCDWRNYAEQAAETLAILRRDDAPPVPPLLSHSLPGATPQDQRRLAERWAKARFGAMSKNAFPQRPRAANGRPRIGFLSGDFGQHPVSCLLPEFLEALSRENVELFAYHYGSDDGSEVRRRLLGTFAHASDIDSLSIQDAARRIHDDNLDVLVDLTGFTRGTRTQILAFRPAPVQVSWLGFPGTQGAPFIDALLADGYLIPERLLSGYCERILRLPCAHQPLIFREWARLPPSRSECGLPESGVVFGAFHNGYKITPDVFSLWMQILERVPGSVLWMAQFHPATAENLRLEAGRHGVAPERLVFAPWASVPEHRNRLRLVDVFLDTLPYNAGATANDVLSAGVPVVTVSGDSYVSRMAGSLLTGLGLADLIAADADGYVNLALELATQEDRRHVVRDEIALAWRRVPPIAEQASGFCQTLVAAGLL